MFYQKTEKQTKMILKNKKENNPEENTVEKTIHIRNFGYFFFCFNECYPNQNNDGDFCNKKN